MEGLALFLLAAKVGEGNLDSCVEEGLLLQSLCQYIKIVNGSIGKECRVGLEGNCGTCLIRFADYVEGSNRFSSFVALTIDVFAVANYYFKVFTQRVNYRRTYAVKSTCNLVSAVAEFTACMQYGINNLDGRDAHFRVHSYGDTASVIGNADDIAL